VSRISAFAVGAVLLAVGIAVLRMDASFAIGRVVFTLGGGYVACAGAIVLLTAAFGRWDGADTAAAAMSPADEVATARAEAAAQLEAVRAEIAVRDAQRRAEMDQRVAQMRSMTTQTAASDGWE